MGMTPDEILTAAKAMTPSERADLIEDLRQLVDDDDELTAEQLAEIRRRIADADSGKEKGVPVEHVVAELRAELRRKRQAS